ncbi:MAG: hypothetical protein LUG52_04870 [Clostridia bacterium]|nr:hypothetical protein [Clostridia bacterium]
MEEIFERPEMEIIIFNSEDVMAEGSFTRSVFRTDDNVLTGGAVIGDSDS